MSAYTDLLLSLDATPIFLFECADASVAAGQIDNLGDGGAGSIWDGGVNTNAPTLQQPGPWEDSFAWAFNGVDDYIGFENSVSRLSASQSGALAMFVKLPVGGASGYPFADGTASSNTFYGLNFNNTTGQIVFLHRRAVGATNQSQHSTAEGTIPTDGEWHFYVVVADGTNPVKIYLDGALMATTVSLAGAGQSSDWWADLGATSSYFPTAGARRTGATAPSNFCQCSLSHLSGHDVAFTEQQVYELWLASGLGINSAGRGAASNFSGIRRRLRRRRRAAEEARKAKLPWATDEILDDVGGVGKWLRG